MKKVKNTKILNKYLTDSVYRLYFPLQIDEYGCLYECNPGEKITYQGQKSMYLYYLCKGRCQVSAYMDNGKQHIINILKAPCLIGEIELINSEYSFAVNCLDECLLIRFPIDIAKDILLKNVNFLYKLCCDLTEKERRHSINLSTATSFPLINRLAKFIIDNSINNVFTVKKSIIALSLGASYRHIEKLMSDLIKDKVLEKKKLTYFIRNKDELIQLSEKLEMF